MGHLLSCYFTFSHHYFCFHHQKFHILCSNNRSGSFFRVKLLPIITIDSLSNTHSSPFLSFFFEFIYCMLFIVIFLLVIFVYYLYFLYFLKRDVYDTVCHVNTTVSYSSLFYILISLCVSLFPLKSPFTNKYYT